MARRLALGCYAGLAALAALDVATLSGLLGAAGVPALGRPIAVIAFALALTGIAVLCFVGVYARTPRVLRWRRTALVVAGLYGAWALLRAFLANPGDLLDLDLAARGAGFLALSVIGAAAAGRAVGQPPPILDRFPGIDPGLPVRSSATGLRWQDLKVGIGPLAMVGRTAVVHYTGWLESGRKFDTSEDRGQPFSFRVGAGEVIKGWDEGVQGLRQGGRRRLVVPPELAYGETGEGEIPGGATLIFDVELVDVR